jgi:ComF family protein
MPPEFTERTFMRLLRHCRRLFCRHVLQAVGSDCPMCGATAAGGRLCAGCLGDVLATMHATQPRCPRCALRLAATHTACQDCARHRPALERTVAAFDYEAPADLLIARFKNELRYGLADLLAELILRALAAPGVAPLPPHTVLVPIPAARTSLRRRGFNPAAEIARALARATGLALRPQWLARVGQGPKQTTLGRADRLRGAIGAYACPLPIRGGTIALVDDVMTTGSTLDAAARALRDAGAGDVLALVAARAPMDDGGTLAQYRLP